MPEFEFPVPVPPKKSQLRYWTNKLWDFGWYRWWRGFCARVYVRLAPVPLPKPARVDLVMMRFRIVLWEHVSYVEAGIDVPGEKVTLLLHPHSNRVVGIKVWG